MFDGYWREHVEKRVDPIGVRLEAAGVTANVLTTTGVVMAAATAVAIGAGRLGWGLVLLIVAAVPDLLDGAVAKASGPTSKRGAFFDSTADRVTDTLILLGVIWYFIDNDDSTAAMASVGVLAASWLISYQRAKAESLGFDAKGGIMERAERIILLAVGLAFSGLLVPVIWVLLLFTLVTATQRFVKVWQQATDEMRTTGS